MESYLLKLPNTVSLAFAVLTGKYGNGEERRIALEKEGYDYHLVQSCVNELVKLINKYGD